MAIPNQEVIRVRVDAQTELDFVDAEFFVSWSDGWLRIMQQGKLTAVFAPAAWEYVGYCYPDEKKK